MEIHFISAVPNLRLSDCNEIDFIDMKIMNFKSFRGVDLFMDNTGGKRFGDLALRRFFESPFLYAQYDIDKEVVDPDSRNIISGYLMKFVAQAGLLSLFLWFIKDNSVGAEIVLIQGVPSEHEEDYNCEKDYFSSACLDSISLSSTQRSISIFSQKEIEECESLMNKIFILSPEIKKGFFEGYHFELERNKLEKALTFLISIRKTRFITAKIALYMSFFECLFTNDSGETTLKVSQRLAFYISNDLKECEKIVKDMKNAYDIRSKYLHGSTPKKKDLRKYETQQDICKDIDGFARRAMRKIINVDSAYFLDTAGNSHEEYMQSLIFRDFTINQLDKK